MKKDIKDYLHYYLGIDVQMDGEKIGKLLGYNFRTLEDGLMILYTVQMGEEEDDWAVYNDDDKMQRIKPLLRPLSDMTEDEANESSAAWLDGNEMKPLPESLIHDARMIHYLLSKHFDLFDLIESGLAIDKTKVP